MCDYIGLDVSVELTHICVVNSDGSVASTGLARTDPDALAAAIRELSSAPDLVVLETGGQSAWLQQGLEASGLNAVIVDARQAKKALSARINKTDANDAEGLAQLARTGWYRRVLAKSPATRRVRAMLQVRDQLVKQRRDLTNQIRGILRSFGLALGSVSHRRLTDRVDGLCADEPALRPVLSPLLAVQALLCTQIGQLDDRLAVFASASADAKRLMSVPGVGPLTALAFMTAIDDPHRFDRSANVGAYLGLTSRRFQSGEVDWSGRISKQGDAMARAMLYEAANALMTRVKRWTRQKAWAVRLAGRRGGAKARVALARKLAVTLHRIWVDGTTFNWSAKAA